VVDGTVLAPVIARVQAGRLAGAGAIGVAAGKLISRHKTGKHFDVAITDDSLTVTRRQARIDEEAAMDGLYVIRTPVPASQLPYLAPAPGLGTADLHRPGPAAAGQPGHPRPAVPARAGQGLIPA
jgi:hypothetical protein